MEVVAEDVGGVEAGEKAASGRGEKVKPVFFGIEQKQADSEQKVFCLMASRR